MNVDAPRLEDRLGPDEPSYRSRGEAQVGRLLDRYGIPFWYESPLIVMDQDQYKCWHPDFTLPHQQGLIVEYAGMPDVKQYMTGIHHKQRVFQENEIPYLFLYPDDLKGPNWPSEVIGKIEKAAEEYQNREPGLIGYGDEY